MSDWRNAWRTIVRSPGLAAVVIVSLGVGIGVNTAIFSWIQALVFQPLPGVSDASAFHAIEPKTDSGANPGVSWLEYRDLRERLSSFGDLIASRMIALNVGDTGSTERVYGMLVSDNYFSVLGLTPAIGRFPDATDTARSGGDHVVVISHDAWRTRFALAPDVVGRTLRVNDRVLTIVAVTPVGFQGTVFGLAFDLFVPATLAPVVLNGSRDLDDRGARGYAAMGRLKPGATLAQAQADVDTAMRDLAAMYPATNRATGADVLPFWRALRGPQQLLLPMLAMLQAILILLLLVVCGNTANLVLARASARQREMGLRLALGAGGWRVSRLVLTENLALAVIGAGLGAAFAAWGTSALRAVPMIGAFPIRFQTHLDAGGLAFAMLLGVVCGLAVGIAPAVQLARIDPARALRTGGQTAPRSVTRQALMGIEVALSMAVLVVAGLFFRSFSDARGIDPGFRREGVMLAAYDLTTRPTNDAFTRDFAGRVLARLRALPQVEAAAVAASVPLDIHGWPIRTFTVEGRARTDAAQDEALANTVTPGYFAVMGIPLVAGADFAALDDAAAPPQVIVNEEFVRRYLDGREPLGRRLQAGGRTSTIVGVARTSTVESFGEPAKAVIYSSYRDRVSPRGEIHVRTRAGDETIGPSVARIVREIDPELPLYDVRTLSDHIERNLFLRRIPARMFVVLGPLILLLAAIGIYAVVAYTVSQRTSEIGLRLAVGATASRVVRQLIVEHMRVIVFGSVLGWALVAGLAIEFGAGTIDPLIFTVVPAVLLAVALAACWLPARRAARVDPMAALKEG